MFRKFLKENSGGLLEYLILICVMAVAAAMLFPSVRDLQVKVFNQSVHNVTSGITGSGNFSQESDVNFGDLPLITPPGTPIYTRTVSLNIPTPRSDYQVKVILTPSNFDYSKAKSDGSDLIFRDLNDNKLSRYIESWNTGGTSTVWVKVKDSGTTKFNINYDKVQTQSNNPKNVYDFYDDFSNFNTGFWKTKNTTSEFVYAQNGVLSVKRGGVTTINELPFDPTEGYYFEVKAKVTYDHGGYSGALASLGTEEFISSGNVDKDATVLLMRPPNTTIQNLTAWIGDGDETRDAEYAYSTSLGLPMSTNSWDTYSYRVLPNKLNIYMNGVNSGNPSINWIKDLNYLILGDYRGAFTTLDQWRTDEMEYDYISVRKSSSVEPVATVGTETTSNN